MTVNTENIKLFKTAYQCAVRNNKEQFIFNNQTVLTSYAKYLIEYFETCI
jgi:hypothetical protein